MGKLLKLSGKDVCKILSTHGFENVRQRGSHVAMQKTGKPTIIRQSSIAKSEFEAK